MSVLALHHHADELGVRRYGAAALAIVLFHIVVIAAAFAWYERPAPAGVSLQPILVELAPAPAAEQVQMDDQGAAQVTQKAEAPPPDPPKQEVIEEQLPPTPPQPAAIVAAPPKVEPRTEPVLEQPPQVRERTKKPVKKQKVEETRAAKADRVDRRQASLSSGASAAAAAASYRSILAAHLQRFKQYPNDARARGEQGTALLTFTVTRDGRVTSSRLARSSGHAALDQETMALIRRAQPLPPFPPEVTLRADTYTVPFSYTIR
jgi:protein TonB